jgi:hypothetical protein
MTGANARSMALSMALVSSAPRGLPVLRLIELNRLSYRTLTKLALSTAREIDAGAQKRAVLETIFRVIKRKVQR